MRIAATRALVGVLTAGFGLGLLGACFDAAFMLGRPCEDDGDCGPTLACINGICGGGEADPLCGNGLVDTNEECDDGNENDNDKCTNTCKLAFCGDGIVETATEECDDANANDSDACTTECKTRHAAACSDLLTTDPEAGDTTLVIDADGPSAPVGAENEAAFEVWCDMTLAGGGWTLVMVASDDAQTTWTWGTRSLLTSAPTRVGDLDNLDSDFLSEAYELVKFTDLMFVHMPSGDHAVYADVGDGAVTLAEFLSGMPAPNCDPNLVDNGFAMTEGTLLTSAQDPDSHLCDTDLYFNVGVAGSVCEDPIPSVAGAFGPVWHGDGTDDRTGECDIFAAPSLYGLGPVGPCVTCPSNTTVEESPHLGFANALGLNTGTPGAAENYMQIYVR